MLRQVFVCYCYLGLVCSEEVDLLSASFPAHSVALRCLFIGATGIVRILVEREFKTLSN